jgi:ribonucleoside-diphosphate reductase alpha chain
MYMYAWKQGLKTTYYLRSRPATKIAKTTVAAGATAAPPPPSGASPSAEDTAAVVCSLENPGSCEACQ